MPPGKRICSVLEINGNQAASEAFSTAVLDELRAEGFDVKDEDVKHLSSACHEHINPHGKYRFNLERELGRQGLRPLRNHSSRPLVPMRRLPTQPNRAVGILIG